MTNIDFLPPRYRERHRQRQAFAWEIAIVAFFGLLIASGVLWQFAEHWRIGSRLTALKGEFEQAEAMQATLEQLQNKLAASSEAAELYLYLHHPWPRTQVLCALEQCLPEGMSLTDVHVSYEAVSPGPALSDEELKKLTLPRRDIMRLRREADRRVAVVKIAGTTGDARLVYDFAHRLGQMPLLASVKLEAAENQAAGATEQTIFRLRGLLKPGYGQPSGPEPSLAEVRN